MSSSISLIPVLDGTNYMDWSSYMKAYLMTQKAWAVVSGEYKKPVLSSPPTAEQVKDALDWAELNYIAVGAINLRLPNHIRLLYASK